MLNMNFTGNLGKLPDPVLQDLLFLFQPGQSLAKTDELGAEVLHGLLLVHENDLQFRDLIRQFRGHGDAGPKEVSKKRSQFPPMTFSTSPSANPASRSPFAMLA